MTPKKIFHDNRVHVPLDSYRPTWENPMVQGAAQIKHWFSKIAAGMHCCALSRLWSFLLAESHCPLTRTKCRTIFRLKGHEHMQMTYVHAPSAAICQDLHFQRALCSKFGSCSQSMKEESMTKNLRMARNTIQQPNSIHVVESPSLFHLLDLGWKQIFPKDRGSGSAEDL